MARDEKHYDSDELTAYAEGRWDELARARFSKHLERCFECAQSYRAMKWVDKALDTYLGMIRDLHEAGWPAPREAAGRLKVSDTIKLWEQLQAHRGTGYVASHVDDCKLVASYYFGDLDAPLKAALEAHAVDCPRCTWLLDAGRKAFERMFAEPGPPPMTYEERCARAREAEAELVAAGLIEREDCDGEPGPEWDPRDRDKRLLELELKYPPHPKPIE